MPVPNLKTPLGLASAKSETACQASTASIDEPKSLTALDAFAASLTRRWYSSPILRFSFSSVVEPARSAMRRSIRVASSSAFAFLSW